MISNASRSCVVVVVLSILPAYAQGLTLPYAGSASTPGFSFDVSNTYASWGTGYAMRATGMNQCSALRATSTVGYAVDAVTVSGYASVISNNSSGTWGIYTAGGEAGALMAYGTHGMYSGYFRTVGCGYVDQPGCFVETNPIGLSAVASAGIRTDVKGYDHGLWVSAKDGAALKAFANGYWEPVVSAEALESSSYGGVGLVVRGRSAYNYAGHIMNMTGTKGLYVSATSGPSNTSLYVSGNVSVTGSLSASVKNFRIDHPLFPDSKYLQHSVIESDQYKVQYDGNVVLDARGEASVTLPAYVELVGGDFRYQLTPIGSAASVYVASELNGGRFTIAGGRAGQKVSWNITGIRKDPAAAAEPLVVEQLKPPEKQGRYLRPELYGQPASASETADLTAIRTPPVADSGKTFGAAQLNPPVRLEP